MISQPFNQDATGGILVTGEGTAGTPVGGVVSIQGIQSSGSGTLTALNTSVNMTPNGMSSAAISVTGTWVGTVQFQGQAGDGVWNPMLGFLPGTGSVVDALTSNGSLMFPIGGFFQIRATFIAYTSGSAVVTFNLGPGINGLQVFNLIGANFQASVLGTGNAGSPSTGVITVQGITNGTAQLVSTKNPLTANAPFTVSVGITSGTFLASNTSRKGLIIVNTSAATVSFGIGTAAVLNSGITLYPGGTWELDEYCIITGAINAIASAAASGVAGQEFQ